MEYWPLGFGPFYIGWAVATGDLFPGPVGFLGMALVGLMLGGFTFTFNAYYDRKIDVSNPRKVNSPLVQGRISPDAVLRLALAFMLISIFSAAGLAYFSGSLAAFIIPLVMLTLSVIYSHPIIRLKSRPGLDILANVVGLGVLSPLLGWSIVKDPLDFPPLFLLSIALVFGGLYSPSTVADYHSDKKRGITSLAVRFGFWRTLWLGLFLLSLGVALLILQGWLEIFPWTRELLYSTGVFLVAQPVAYALLLKYFSLRGIYPYLVANTFLQGLGNGIFFLIYSGTL